MAKYKQPVTPGERFADSLLCDNFYISVAVKFVKIIHWVKRRRPGDAEEARCTSLSAVPLSAVTECSGPGHPGGCSPGASLRGCVLAALECCRLLQCARSLSPRPWYGTGVPQSGIACALRKQVRKILNWKWVPCCPIDCKCILITLVIFKWLAAELSCSAET